MLNQLSQPAGLLSSVNQCLLILGALEDFDKNAPSTTKQSTNDGIKPSSSTDKGKTKVGQSSTDTTLKTPISSDSSASSQDDSNAQMEAQFVKVAEDLENAMKTMLGNEPDLLAHLNQFAQAAANADHGKV